MLNFASQILDGTVTISDDKIAASCGGEIITYKKLRENVNRFANVLADLKVAPTERVMLVLPDSPVFIYTFIGSIKYGALPVPVSTTLSEDDYRFMLEDSKARVLVTSKNHKAARVKTACSSYKLFYDNGLESLMNVASPDATVYPTREEDVAFWLYAPEGTGRPRGMSYRHIDAIHSTDDFIKNTLQGNGGNASFPVDKLFFAYGLGKGQGFNSTAL